MNPLIGMGPKNFLQEIDVEEEVLHILGVQFHGSTSGVRDFAAGVKKYNYSQQFDHASFLNGQAK